MSMILLMIEFCIKPPTRYWRISIWVAMSSTWATLVGVSTIFLTKTPTKISNWSSPRLEMTNSKSWTQLISIIIAPQQLTKYSRTWTYMQQLQVAYVTQTWLHLPVTEVIWSFKTQRLMIFKLYWCPDLIRSMWNHHLRTFLTKIKMMVKARDCWVT